MSIDRFKVRAKRKDNGKIVEGFIMPATIVYNEKYYMLRTIIQQQNKEYSLWESVAIDPYTIEPIALKVYIIEKYMGAENGLNEKVAYCPTCGHVLAIIDSTPYKNYCQDCGQRLDWFEIIKDEENT